MVGKRQQDLEGDLFPRGAAPDATPRVQKRNGQTLFGPQLKRPRLTRPPEIPPDAPVLQHGASLSMSRLSIGMTILCLITRADRSGIELVLPGGLRGSVASNELLLEQNIGRMEINDSEDSSSEDSFDEDVNSMRPAWEVVSVGNVLPATVVDIEVSDHGKKVVKLSLKPHLINVGLNPSLLLSKNFPVYGAIKSMEDHGYVISFGANIPHSGFLPFEKLSASSAGNLLAGTPIMVSTSHSIKTPGKRTKSFASSVRVSALESDVLNVAVDAEGMTYQGLKAGMLLRSRVLREGSAGLSLSALGVFKLDVDAAHVPRKADGSWDVTVGKHVLARLLYVDPSLKRVGASLLSCFVAKLSPRSVPPHWRTGTRLKALKVERIKSGFGLFLRYMKPKEVTNGDGTNIHIERNEDTAISEGGYDVPIFAHISRVSDSKGLSLESKYHENSVIKNGARVVSIARFDGVINVDLRPSVLSRKALSLEEIEPGIVYDCKILSHTTMGSLMVAVDSDPYIPGIVLPAHISDVPIPSKRLTKNPIFRIGSSVRCRALAINKKKGKVFLTARKSLVSPKYPVLTSYNQAAEAMKESGLSTGQDVAKGGGVRFTGISKCVTRKGSLLVNFCHGVVGLVPATEFCLDRGKQSSQSEIESLYPVGETVQVRLLKVDEKKRQMLLSVNLEVRNEGRHGIKTFRLGHRVQGTISGVDEDSRHFLVHVPARTVCGRGNSDILGEEAKNERSPVKVTETQNDVECHLPFGHLSDNAGVAERIANELQLRLKELGEGKGSYLELPEAMVLNYRDKTAVLTTKNSLMTAKEADRLPGSYDDIQLLNASQGERGNTSHALRGYIKALLPTGAIVGFLGDCVGFVRNSRVADRFISDPARCLEINQSVCAIVESVDESSKRFYLSMRPSDIGTTGVEDDTFSLFRSLEKWQRSLGVSRIENEFHIGDVITASVSAVLTYGVKYELSSEDISAVGVAYEVRRASDDVVLNNLSAEFREGAPQSKTSNPRPEPDLSPLKVERVRVLDVDPLTSVVDLSRDESVVAGGEKKSVISTGSSLDASVLLVKSAYVILAVKRSKTRTAIAYALGPVTQENLLIRPGAQVKCTVLDKGKANTCRNLVLVDWDSFRSTSNEVCLQSTGRHSECAKTISILQASGNLNETSLLGMKIAGKVTRKFRLHAFVAVAPGIVGQIHIANTSCVTSEDLAQTRLGIVPPEIASRFVLPELGRNIKQAYFAGLRQAAGPSVSDPVVIEISLCKERCFVHTPFEGEKVIGFVMRPSSRFTTEAKPGNEKETLAHTLVAISPTRLISCADVDCLFSEKVTIEPGTPVVCQVLHVHDDGTERMWGAISENGGRKHSPFLAIVQSVHSGRGLRVSIPWHARDMKAKSVSWGFVDICDVADNYDETIKIMSEVKPGSIVQIQAVITNRDMQNEGKYHVTLSMRGLQRSGAKDPLLTRENLDVLKAGTSVRGFVQGVGKKGCFVSIGRNIFAQVRLCDLSDEFVKDPQMEFPVGKLVSGYPHVIKKANEETKIALVLRKRPRKKLRTVSVPPQLKEGSKVCGEVIRIAEYGALIEIGPSLTGLLHKSEADQDRYINDPQEEWFVGQKLTAIVIKLVGGKISLGTKRCYFEAAGVDGNSIDELLANNENSKREITAAAGEIGDKSDEVLPNRDAPHEADVELDSDLECDHEIPGEAQDSSPPLEETKSKLDFVAPKEHLEFQDSSVQMRSVAPLAVLGGFDFAETLIKTTDEDKDSGFEFEVAKVGVATAHKQSVSSSRVKREKQRMRAVAERDIRLREEALANNPNAPETADDFERLLLGEPNSSVLWIRYMAFSLQLSQADKARSIAERALETISLEAEAERVNVWCAYVNLEAQFGCMNATERENNDALGTKRAAAIFRVFDRACERITDVKAFHLQISAALQRSFPDLADEVLRRAIRRFKGSSKVWIALGQSHFTKGEVQVARKTLERALMTLEKRKHLHVITKFAQFEYRYGNAERGRTVFESLIGNFANRVDLWSVYLDMETSQCLRAGEDSRYDIVSRTRQLFERFTSLDLNSKKMKFAFKKWLRFEKIYGSKETEAEVKSRAQSYVDRNISDTNKQ